MTTLPVHAYYRDPGVQARMREDIGERAGGPATAAYLSGLGFDGGSHPSWETATLVHPRAMAELWQAGCDISRALWDEQSLIFLLDVDYQNIDQPAEPFLRPAEVFVKLEPVYRAVRRILAEHDIHATPILTGRGYHFTGRVPLEAPVVSTLAALWPAIPSWYDGVERRRPPGVTAAMSLKQARAWGGLGLLVEFLAHQIVASAQPESRIPVVVNGTVVGRGAVGRECTSLDFSHFGDPLDVRHLRVLFSTYQWHLLRPDIFGEAVADAPPLASVPRGRAGLLPMLQRGRDLGVGIELAKTPAPMPDLSAGLNALVTDYQASTLAAFHRAYLDGVAHGTDLPAAPDVNRLPPCVRTALERPNDLLLKPAHLQHVVRGLMARGYSPPSIAALVERTYTADHDWGPRWLWMDPHTRASFDVRVFAGLVVTGHDTLVDFNCVSAQEKDLCPGLPCRLDLRDDRERIRRLVGCS